MSTSLPIAVITGATGLIGSHLTAELLARGYRVRALIRNPERLSVLRKTLARLDRESDFGKIDMTEVSLLNPIRMSRLMEKSDVVVHAAGIVDYDPGQEQKIIETNTHITANTACAALKAGVGRFVHISSIATLGEAQPSFSDASHPFLIHEHCLLTRLKGRSAYSISKFYAENAVWRAAAQGLRTLIVNPAIVLGEGEWEKSSGPLIAQAVHHHGFYTDGVKGYVDVRDVARATVSLLETDAALGRRFILSGANLSFRELFSLAARAAGKRPPYLKAGRKLLTGAAILERFRQRMQGGTIRLTPEVINNALDRSYYDGSLVTRTCHFTYTPIEQTLTRVVQAYLKEKKT